MPARSQWASTRNHHGQNGKGSTSLPESTRIASGTNERYSHAAQNDAHTWNPRHRGKGRHGHTADDLSHTEQTAFAVAFAAIDDSLGPPVHNASVNFKGRRPRASGGCDASVAPGNATASKATIQPQNGSVQQNCADIEASTLESNEDDVAENPGSVGHPELCPRPCLYFASGRCANGTTCNFCHLPHPKRPAHLDKRHRIMLKEMSFHECLSMMLPILRQKLNTLDCGPSITDLLDTLEVSVSASQAPGGTHALQTALRAMSLRSLLTALHRQALPQLSPEQAAIDSLLQQLRFRDEGCSQTGLPLTAPPYTGGETVAGHPGPWGNEEY